VGRLGKSPRIHPYAVKAALFYSSSAIVRRLREGVTVDSPNMRY
jgi:hypothetical protein